MNTLSDQEKIERIEEKMKEIMGILNMPFTPSTKDTPKRIAKMYVNEVFKNISDNHIHEKLFSKIKTFPYGGNEQLVIVKDIPFYSMCEHHFMPFSGKVSIGYVTKDEVIGLSKLPRIVEYFSKKPQLQERLAFEIASCVNDMLHDCMVFVMIRDTVHTCVTARGIEKDCSTDTFYSIMGSEEDEEKFKEYKAEFLQRIGGR